jgi:hypothetical protein
VWIITMSAYSKKDNGKVTNGLAFLNWFSCIMRVNEPTTA